jgi:hypothetical protein
LKIITDILNFVKSYLINLNLSVLPLLRADVCTQEMPLRSPSFPYSVLTSR